MTDDNKLHVEFSEATDKILEHYDKRTVVNNLLDSMDKQDARAKMKWHYLLEMHEMRRIEKEMDTERDKRKKRQLKKKLEEQLEWMSFTVNQIAKHDERNSK